MKYIEIKLTEDQARSLRYFIEAYAPDTETLGSKEFFLRIADKLAKAKTV